MLVTREGTEDPTLLRLKDHIRRGISPGPDGTYDARAFDFSSIRVKLVDHLQFNEGKDKLISKHGIMVRDEANFRATLEEGRKALEARQNKGPMHLEYSIVRKTKCKLYLPIFEDAYQTHNSEKDAERWFVRPRRHQKKVGGAASSRCSKGI